MHALGHRYFLSVTTSDLIWFIPFEEITSENRQNSTYPYNSNVDTVNLATFCSGSGEEKAINCTY